MGIASMTGFSSAQGQDYGRTLSWVWEARSVNGKGLDIRIRWPQGWDSIEAPSRDLAQKCLSRGSIALSLSLNDSSRSASGLTINREWLATLIALAEDLPPSVGQPRLDGLLRVRGVIEESAASSEAEAHPLASDLVAVVLETLSKALEGLVAVRCEEGGRLHTVLQGHLASLESLIQQAGETASARPGSVRRRLEQQLAVLLDSKVPVPEERLAQELALIATRLDIREELDRLSAHVAQARQLLETGGVCGRRLDFLCQEFNREANTLCSKSQDADLTRLGLDLKTVIDQLREQVQNIE